MVGAVTGRLGGLASGTAGHLAEPLVRDAFRRQVMDAAGAAAETSLAGLPAGPVTSRADALRVVEAIELLLDADQWQPAQDIVHESFRRPWCCVEDTCPRPGSGSALPPRSWPRARLTACSAQLGRSALGVYRPAPVCGRRTRVT